jgi:DNA ligase-1
MKRFAHLLERLVFTPSRNAKLRLLTDYVRHAPSPDRGWGIAALGNTLDIPGIKPTLLRSIVTERTDPELFALSYDFVGDLAETVALIWMTDQRQKSATDGDPSLDLVVTSLMSAQASNRSALVTELLDRLDASERVALLKLVTGGLRVGVSSGLLRQALADFGDKPVSEVTEVWHAAEPPYDALFDWLEGRAPAPSASQPLRYRPVMLAHPADAVGLGTLDPDDFVAEWKWDGIRGQLVHHNGATALFSRSGDDISQAFPDITSAISLDCVLDGEVLVGKTSAGHGDIGSFGDLQSRLNRKTVSKQLLRTAPALFRCYDVLEISGREVRDLGFTDRRVILEQLVSRLDKQRFDLSEVFPIHNWEALDALRAAPPHPHVEGVMIKSRDGAYLAGRIKGHWFKWKKEPFRVDAVMMYAQRGHGKRSGLYSDFTFGVWMDGVDGRALVPVGKAYFGFTDTELDELDAFVRGNTIERFGPVRSVRAEPQHGFVLEIAFEGLNRSSRHKSGVAMRFPRIARLRRDKNPEDADTIETLQALLPPVT